MFIFNFWEYENHLSKLILYHTVRFFFLIFTFFKHFLTRKIFYALLDKKHKSLHQKTWILKKLTILWYVLQKSLCYNNKHWHSCVACCGKTETWAAASTYFIKEEITFLSALDKLPGLGNKLYMWKKIFPFKDKTYVTVVCVLCVVSVWSDRIRWKSLYPEVKFLSFNILYVVV